MSASSFATRAIGLTTARLISVSAGFLTGVIGARVLGTEGTGAAGIAVVLAGVAAIASNGGINISTIYLLGRGRDRGRQLVNALIPMALAGALVAALALGLLAGTIGPLIGLEQRFDLFLTAAILAAGFVMFEFGGAVLLGVGMTGSYTRVELVRAFATLAATALLLLGAWRSDVGFVAAAVIGQGVATAVAGRSVARALGTSRPMIDPGVTRTALEIGLRGQIGNVLQFMNLRLDQVMVPLFLSLSSAGIYLIAVRVSEAIAQVGSAVGSLIFPEVARADDPSHTTLTERAVRVTVIAMAGAGLIVGILAESLLSVAFGPEFADGAFALRILLVAMVPLSVVRVLAGDLKGRGRPGTVSVAMGLAVLVNLGLNIVLIPRFGIDGAAAASVVTYTVTAITLTAAFVVITGARAAALVPRPSDLTAIADYVGRVGKGGGR